jgi:type III pantothenate kinase
VTLLALDIGNTATKAGVFRDGQLVASDSAPTSRLAQNQHRWLMHLLGSVYVGIPRLNSVAIASVVPSATAAWQKYSENRLKMIPFVITGETPTPLKMAYRSPSTLGADRLAHAVAASHLQRTPVICASVGTATVIDAVSLDKTFLGGVIMPGIDLLLKTLAINTAQLPEIEATPVESVIGGTTAECISSGAIVGTAAAIEGLAKRLSEYLGVKSTLVISGGHAPLVLPHLSKQWNHSPTLGIEGIHYIWQYTNGK